MSYALLEESGPDHKKFFRAAVMIGGKSVAEGSGSSKKRAEQQADRAREDANRMSLQAGELRAEIATMQTALESRTAELLGTCPLSRAKDQLEEASRGDARTLEALEQALEQEARNLTKKRHLEERIPQMENSLRDREARRVALGEELSARNASWLPAKYLCLSSAIF